MTNIKNDKFNDLVNLCLMTNLAELLVTENAVQVNFDDPFVWTSGLKAPMYCDCRELTGNPEARDQIVKAFMEVAKETEADVIAGTATAGISWAAFVADRLGLPMIYVRPKPKGYGAGKMVEGKVSMPKPKVLVIEDAFSTGGSSIRSAEALRRELGATVETVLGIFSWDTPQFFVNADSADLDMKSFANFESIVQALKDLGKIDEAQEASLRRFHKDPEGWADKA